MSLSKSIARKIVFPFVVNVLHYDKHVLKKRQKNCLIINFHGVTDVQGNRFNNRHLDVNEFEKLIVYLKSNFEVVSLTHLFDIHRNKTKLNRKTVAITFDDGYLNNFITALPLLKKHQCPATFYLISKGLVDNNFYVWPDIVDLIQRDAKEDIVIDGNVFKYPGFYCETIGKSLVDFLKASGTKLETYVAELSLKFPAWKNTITKFPQLIELIRQKDFPKYAQEPLVEYGSHSHTHLNLENLTEEECNGELNKSKTIISGFINKPIVSLAFPDGSYNLKTLEIGIKEGFHNMVAVDYKFAENNKNPNLLSRFTISNSTTYESNVMRLVNQYDKYGF